MLIEKYCFHNFFAIFIILIMTIVFYRYTLQLVIELPLIVVQLNMKLLISYGDIKRVITVDHQSAVPDVARNVFHDEIGDNQFKMEYYEKTFDSFVQLHDMSTIVDGLMLRLILSTSGSK